MYYLISILFGLIPEVLYFTLFLMFTKKITEKRMILFIMISISYFLCLLVQQFNFIFYLLFIVFCYISLKIIYGSKTQVIDIFIISISHFWIALLSFILFLFLKEDNSNYYFLYLIDRILLFLPLLFKNKLSKFYMKYKNFWNRNDEEKRPIKSITLRNISLILLNSFILFLDMAISNINLFIK